MKRIQNQLTLIVAVSFLLIPLTTTLVGLTLGILDPELLQQHLTARLLIIISGCLLIWAIFHFHTFLFPLRQAGTHQHPCTPISSAMQGHLADFTLHYWGFCLFFILILPVVYQTTSRPMVTNASMAVFSPQTLQLGLLVLVISILVALPGYLLSLTVLGRLSKIIGLPAKQVSLHSKIMLVGAYIPLLTTAFMVHYVWWKSDSLSAELIGIWMLMGLSAIICTVIAVQSLKESLSPVQGVMQSSSASHRHLAQQLIPQSNDEIGYLMQTLGKLFARLGEQESYMYAIVNNAAEAIIASDNQAGIKLFNPAAERLFGYTSAEVQGQSLISLLPGMFSVFGSPIVVNDNNITNETEARQKSGRNIPVTVRISSMCMENNICYTYLVQDNSKRKSAELQLRNAEDRYRSLVETAHDLVWSMDPDGNWTYLNNAVTRIYGYQIEEMVGHHYSQFQSPNMKQRDAEALQKLQQGEELVLFETIHLHKDGSERHISFNAKPSINKFGKVIAIAGTARDITEQKAYERELTYQNQHDTLTGLLNRRYFHLELTRVIARVARSGMECALFYLDLDQFKYINDTLGHAAGDRLLIECTRLLQKHTRDGDLLARFGGDEFTILLYNITPHQAQAVAEHLRSLFDVYRFYEAGKSYSITCSIGISTIDNSINTADEALSHADLACNVAKAQGRNCVHISNKRDEEKMGMSNDMGWAARVRDAYENNRFQLMYQPIYSIAHENIHDYEVLLRIPMDDGSVILPGGFIPAAERFGLIHNVDRWTVKNAIQSLSELHSEGQFARFAINLSGRAFEDRELLPLIGHLLKETGLDPELLTFEITETEAIANLSSATSFIHQLKDIGCRFALDDFGSGFCSFSYLKNLPVDILKIDGSFVQGMNTASVDQAMVQSMNQVAHALGKKTIAEFVENKATLNLLKDYGVDYAQGHYLGKPKYSIITEPQTKISRIH